MRLHPAVKVGRLVSVVGFEQFKQIVIGGERKEMAMRRKAIGRGNCNHTKKMGISLTWPESRVRPALHTEHGILDKLIKERTKATGLE